MTTICPDCRNALTIERYIPAAVIAEYVVSHRILSPNRFDPATITVDRLGEPTDAELAVDACTVRAASTGSDPDDLTARQTRKRVQHAERVMACTVCNHTHRELAGS
jgi:hypothetical protein